MTIGGVWWPLATDGHSARINLVFKHKWNRKDDETFPSSGRMDLKLQRLWHIYCSLAVFTHWLWLLNMHLQYQWKYLLFFYLLTTEITSRESHLVLSFFFALFFAWTMKQKVSDGTQQKYYSAVTLLVDIGLFCNYLCWYIFQP